MSFPLLLLLAAAPDPALLDQVAARVTAVQAFTDQAKLKVKLVADELDGAGATTKHTETTFRVTRKDGRRLSRELLSALEDGKDVTEARRAEFEQEDEAKTRAKRGNLPSLPFHPDQRAKYAFSLLEPSAPGLIRIGFHPVGEKREDVVVGDASIDPLTFDLVRVSMRPAKNPSMVDKLTFELAFDAPTPAGRALSKLTARGHGGLLFFKKGYALTTTLSDYAPRE